MSTTAISSGSTLHVGESNQMAQMKQNFDALGSALQSGNLDDAKKAFAQLQKNAPAQSGSSRNPVSSEMESLSKALNSGDLKAAQEAYSNIQQKMSQGPSAGAPAGGRSPQGGSGNSEAKSSASSIDVYDKMDSNKDGTVSSLERLSYELKHPNASTSASASASDTTSETSPGKTEVETYA